MSGEHHDLHHGEHRAPVDVLMLLVKAGELLLTKRAGNSYGSGWWAIPSGHVEAGEDVVSAAVRELKEELGVDVKDGDLSFVGVTHARPPDSDPRVGFGFLVSRWDGTPANREPDRCSELRWRPVDDLPAATMPYTREIVRLYREGQTFSRPGWAGRDPDVSAASGPAPGSDSPPGLA